MVYHENTSEKWDIPWYTMKTQVTSGIFHGVGIFFKHSYEEQRKSHQFQIH